jgi:hypothetical protein
MEILCLPTLSLLISFNFLSSFSSICRTISCGKRYLPINPCDINDGKSFGSRNMPKPAIAKTAQDLLEMLCQAGIVESTGYDVG